VAVASPKADIRLADRYVAYTSFICGDVGYSPRRGGDTQLEATVATGTVKWFNPAKGFGFIQPQGGGQDAFVHISAVERAGLTTLNEGQQVEYEMVTGRNGKTSAENLKVK
jgi:CspA family cold shock protein